MTITVIVVTILSCIERALGFGYRIFLSRAIGSEGLGLYQIALSIIGVLITLSASGIPITVSRLMIKEKARNQKNAENKAVSAGIVTALITSSFLCAFFFIFKNSLNVIFADSRCNVLFLIILPGVVLTSVYAVIRGFFWGTKSFYTYSIIELLEEIIMIVCGIYLVLKGESLFQKAIYASVAVLLSYLFSFTLSSAVFIAKGGRILNPKNYLKPLISSSAPITFMKTANSFTASLIAIVFPLVLISNGLDKERAISEFGIISGMALPLLFIPSTLIGSLSLVISPELAENYYKNKVNKIKSDVEKALSYSLFISILIIPAFAGVGKYLGEFLYNNELAGIYIRNSAFMMIPMRITIISTSLLNSMGFEKTTLKYYIFSSIALIISILIFPKYIGNYSLIIGYFASYCISSIFNIIKLSKVCKQNLNFTRQLLKGVPLCFALCFLNYFLFNLISNLIHPFLAMLLSCFITLIANVLCLISLGLFSFKIFKKSTV